MYGLPKIHKNGVPVRPIISAIGTYNYNLAKYLDEILKPLISDKSFIIKDTFDFVNRISKLIVKDGEIMVSFDIVSLFTNIPTLETIEIILNRAYTDNDLFHGMDRETLKKLLIICTQESHFQFNGKFYDQKDGVAMGSPLGPLFAIIFMDEFEHKHMERLKELGVATWMRYVDDIFSLLRDRTCLENILKFINDQHPNIKFTTECEIENKIPFLDTCVTRKPNGFSTKIYHKPTFTGVYLNWTSLTSRKYKISLIYCLCDRIWKICQDPNERDLEFNKLKHTLIKNEYPELVIDKEIEKFIKNRTQNTKAPNEVLIVEEQPQNDEQTQQTAQDQDELEKTRLFEELPKPQQQPPKEKQKKYIVLPYSNHKVDEFAGRLTKLVNDNFEQVDLKIAFKAPKEIGKMFPFKDNIRDKDMQSLVVYRIKCETCGQEYIGKTERILAHRIKEHNNPKSESAIQTHKKENPTHQINASNIEILDKADNNFKLMLKEMLHINTHKPELNTQHAASYKKQKNKDMFIHQLNTIIIARQA
jgi:predicted GIY-YIG superfamily endonuclease